jgi:surface antigen
MMLSISKAVHRGLTGTALLALSLAVPASQAQASPFLAATSPALTARLATSMMLANQCYWFVHDANGNRISYGSVPVGTGMAWGTSSFGCSKWGS